MPKDAPLGIGGTPPEGSTLKKGVTVESTASMDDSVHEGSATSLEETQETQESEVVGTDGGSDKSVVSERSDNSSDA